MWSYQITVSCHNSKLVIKREPWHKSHHDNISNKSINNIYTKDPLNPKDVNISNRMKIPSPTSEPTNMKDPSAATGSKASSNICNTKEDHPPPYDGKNTATAKAPTEAWYQALQAYDTPSSKTENHPSPHITLGETKISTLRKFTML